MHGVDVAIAICEDLWQDGGPVAATRAAGAGLLLVINGSPYELNKDDVRLELCRRRAAEAGCTLAYVNMVGGQDELVFDGDSLVVAADGEVLRRARSSPRSCVVVDLDLPAADDRRPGWPDADGRRRCRSPEPFDATTRGAGSRRAARRRGARSTPRSSLALRDYVRKNGFRSVVICGLSGGIDSALVAAIACDALGAENVYGVCMPERLLLASTRATTPPTWPSAPGCTSVRSPIAPMVDAYQRRARARPGSPRRTCRPGCAAPTLMGLSNQQGHLVLATGNKSELAVGYSTIYGDAVGGFAPIKDVPKTLVWALAALAQRARRSAAARRRRSRRAASTSRRRPSCGPGQLDTDSLPDYDAARRRARRLRRAATAAPPSWSPPASTRRWSSGCCGMVDTAEYKRRQYPPGPKISCKAFGRDRRLPITNRWRESAGRSPSSTASTQRAPTLPGSGAPMPGCTRCR